MTERRRRTMVGDMFLAVLIAASAAHVANLLLRLWG
jgi:hypothetical protein